MRIRDFVINTSKTFKIPSENLGSEEVTCLITGNPFCPKSSAIKGRRPSSHPIWAANCYEIQTCTSDAKI